MIPRAATDHFDNLERLTGVATAGARRAWRQMRGQRWEAAWRSTVGPQVNEVLSAAQEAAAAAAAAYMSTVLGELDIPAAVPTTLVPSAFVGVTGAGTPIETATYGAIIYAAKAQYRPDMAALPPLARERTVLADAEDFLADTVATIMADVARAAELAAMTQREWVTGYVRMIEPGACSRCVVLAGKFYLHNDGFERHPLCRCVHIPADENISDDLLTNPEAYFHSLSADEQDQVFTAAGADAVRLGADVTQVVNARRGMTTAQQNPRGWIAKGRLIPTDVHGRPTYVTTEGTTRHGVARKSMGATRPVRLMPESIVRLSDSPEERIRLLKLYGYIEDKPRTSRRRTSTPSVGDSGKGGGGDAAVRGTPGSPDPDAYRNHGDLTGFTPSQRPRIATDTSVQAHILERHFDPSTNGSQFPKDRWTAQQIFSAVDEVLRDPAHVANRDRYQIFSGTVRDTRIQVRLLNGRIDTAYPVDGPGVTRNGKIVQLPANAYPGVRWTHEPQ